MNNADPRLLFDTILNLQEELGKQYFREHKSYLINLHDVRSKELLELHQAESLRRYLRKRDALEIGNKTGDTHYFITIAPKHDINFTTFKDVFDKYIKSSFIKNPIYSFEQTGTDEESIGYHPHVHILIPKPVGVSPKQAYNRTVRTFGKISGAKSIKVDSIPHEWYQEKIDYLKGVKWDPDKADAIKLNQEWRDKMGLKKIYGIV